MSKVEIIPAILPLDFAEVVDKTELMQGLVETVQIDVCDGQFTSEPTWPYRKHDDNFDKILREEEGLPGWEKLNFEIDLMANKPEEKVDEWVSAGATRIIIHAEAKGDVGRAIGILEGRVEVGLALNIETDLEVINTHREKIQFVQLMGIDHIGFQHQAFDDKVLGKIREVRMKYPGLPISIDGGVSLETAPDLIAAGADRLVAGSAIYNADNPIEAVEKFRQLS